MEEMKCGENKTKFVDNSPLIRTRRSHVAETKLEHLHGAFPMNLCFTNQAATMSGAELRRRAQTQKICSIVSLFVIFKFIE